MNNLLKHFVGIPPVYLYAPTRPLFTQIANTDIYTPRPEIETPYPPIFMRPHTHYMSYASFAPRENLYLSTIHLLDQLSH